MSLSAEIGPRIFVSYRRDDSVSHARRIHAWLRERIGSGAVFLDVEAITPGDDYARTIDREIRKSHLVLALIGRRWNACLDSDGLSRLEKPEDLVRIELLTAIGSGVRVVPVLVDDAASPSLENLPSSLHRLARLNAVTLNEDNFDDNMLKLLAIAQRSVADQQPGQNGSGNSFASARQAMIKKKIALVGANGVGKTSLVQRYVASLFSERYHTTVGVKIDKKYLKIADQELTLLIWDMAGEEEGAPIRMNQLSDADGMIYVIDGCSNASFDTALRIRQRFIDRSHQLGRWNVPEILVLNKADIQNEWQIDMSRVFSLENAGLVSFTTSAKTGKGVEWMFSHLARKILENHSVTEHIESPD